MKQKNKITFLMMLLAAASFLVQSCGKDNMKYPSSTISGRFTYNGQPVGLVYANPDFYFNADNSHNLAFQQTAGKQNIYGVGEIKVYAQHDGTFTSKFFDGDYTYRTLPNVNPFEDFSGKKVTVNGDTQMGNLEVVPYFWMSGLQTTFTGGTGGATGVFTATLNLTKVSTADATKTLQYVAIYLSATNRPDAASAAQGAARTFNAGTNSGGIVVPATSIAAGVATPCTVKVDLSTLNTTEKQYLTTAIGTNGHIWATVAVKTNKITNALYSDPIQLQ